MENLSEVESDDPIEDDNDGAKSSAPRSKRATNKRTKGRRASQKKIKKM